MGSNHYHFQNEIRSTIEGSISVKEQVIQHNVDQINDVANTLITALNNDKKILWCGNGGSAADAQHLACELVSKFFAERPALRSLALTTNTSILTAVSNDFVYDDVFARQVEAIADPGDILIGITTSGTSKNIIHAFKTANEQGITTIALTGKHTDTLAPYADYLIGVPSTITPHIQESHIMIGHILCYLIEKTLFGDKTWATEQSLLTETEP